MSVNDEINRISNAKTNLATAITSKGVNVPNDASISDYAALVSAIPQESGNITGSVRYDQEQQLTNNEKATARKNIGLSNVASSGNYNDLSNKPSFLVASNKGYGGAITAGGDGVAEMGKYIDFHSEKDGESDYSTRLTSVAEYKNTVNLPSGNGTLTIGDKAYKIVVSTTAPTTTDSSVITFVI